MKRILLLFLLIMSLAGCSDDVTNPYGDEKMVLQQEGVYTMFDGREVSHLTMGMMKQDYYCIENKGEFVEILMIEEPAGPQGVKNDGLCFDDLNETAKAAIGAYYDGQGLKYDVAFEVENAYAEYERRDNNKRLFNWHYISQTVWPTGGTQKVIAFCTEVMLYRGEEDARQEWYNAVFDRETGEQIPIETLFLSEDDAKKVILENLMPEELTQEDEGLYDQMNKAFSFSYVKLMNDGIEVMFPAGTLECREKAFGGFIPETELESVMQPWAMNNN